MAVPRARQPAPIAAPGFRATWISARSDQAQIVPSRVHPRRGIQQEPSCSPRNRPLETRTIVRPVLSLAPAQAEAQMRDDPSQPTGAGPLYGDLRCKSRAQARVSDCPCRAQRTRPPGRARITRPCSGGAAEAPRRPLGGLQAWGVRQGSGGRRPEAKAPGAGGGVSGMDPSASQRPGGMTMRRSREEIRGRRGCAGVGRVPHRKQGSVSLAIPRPVSCS
jgi:hypothetical protein